MVTTGPVAHAADAAPGDAHAALHCGIADDQIDDIVDWWCSTNPDIDPTVKKVGMRMRRAAHQFERILRRELAAHDTELWEFEVLAALFRSDGHRCSAGELQRQAGLTSGAITNRVGRLEERGWVRRDVDRNDRRQVIVTLTPDGEARARRILAVKTSTDANVFGRLDTTTRANLDASLRQLMAILQEVDSGS